MKTRILAALVALFLWLPVANADNGHTGIIGWTKTTVALDGSSDQMLGINPLRAGAIACNPSTNNNVWINLAGTTATIEQDFPVLPGTCFSILGQPTPVNAITVIGTTGQNIYVFEGN